MNTLNKDIEKRISQLRKTRRITQEKLSEELDVTIKRLSAVEHGVSSLSLEKIIATSQIFNCTLDYLLLGNNSSNCINMLPASILSVISSNDEKEIGLLLEYLNLYDKLRK